MITTDTMTVRDMHAYLVKLIAMGEGDAPLVIAGPSPYGTCVRVPSPITFRSVFDDENDVWVNQETKAYDLFDENAPSPFSCSVDEGG